MGTSWLRRSSKLYSSFISGLMDEATKALEEIKEKRKNSGPEDRGDNVPCLPADGLMGVQRGSSRWCGERTRMGKTRQFHVRQGKP